jgi:hypothetical protein
MSGSIDIDWDGWPVVDTGEVRLSSKTAKQRFADISPNCASKPKSMTPSGKMLAKSPRCRIASRSTPQVRVCRSSYSPWLKGTFGHHLVCMPEESTRSE